MGHTFDGIDSRYYTDILFKTFRNCKWTIYYHGDTQEEKDESVRRINLFFNGLITQLIEW